MAQSTHVLASRAITSRGGFIMIYTNNYNLPESIFRALKNDDYDLSNAPDNIVSVTTLIDAPKVKVLMKRHWNDLEVDASDSIWKLFGSSIHHVLEMSNKNKHDSLSEERWFLDVSDLEIYTLKPGEKPENSCWYESDKMYVSGKLDNYIEPHIEDYKVTSVWSYIFEPNGKPEHHWQINIHALALKLLGFPVNSGRIIMILRDFQNSKTGTDYYPDIPIQTIDIPIKNTEEIIAYIENRCANYTTALTLSDNDIAPCTKEERWYRDGKLAVMKEGRKSALKLFSESEREDAVKFMELQEGGKFYIEERPGTSVRCEGYCDCRNFCDFYCNNVK